MANFRTSLIVLGVLSLPLGSCTYSYRLLAVAIGGRLAFVVDKGSSRIPGCINGIRVAANNPGSVVSQPTGGDDPRLVSNGVVWWKSVSPDCRNHFPIFYGQLIEGNPTIYPENAKEYDDPKKAARTVKAGVQHGIPLSSVDAKLLRIGVVYQVTATTGSVGYGRGWFSITPDRRIKNWDRDPSPEKSRDIGYDEYGPFFKPPRSGRGQ